MKAEIICIGTELLLGQIVDTNAAFLARELADLGIDLYHKTTVGDNLERLTASLRQAWERADLLLLSGGLGPTQDDLTREGVAGLLGEALEFRPEAWEQVIAYFTRTGRSYPESNRRQAMFPRSAEVILNRLGTAPGVLVARDGHYLMAMPGVPSELKGIWADQIRPYLKSVLAAEGGPVLTSRLVRMAGIGESAMEERILDLIRNQTNPTIAPYAGLGEVSLRISAKSKSEAENLQLIDGMTAEIKARLGEFIYGYDKTNLETVCGELLHLRGWRLATAESCTGGLIAHRITNVSGSSGYFLGGVNSYSNQLKMELVGVPGELIGNHGAVSPEVNQGNLPKFLPTSTNWFNLRFINRNRADPVFKENVFNLPHIIAIIVSLLRRKAATVRHAGKVKLPVKGYSVSGFCFNHGRGVAIIK